jgi:phosphatidylserine/phosphatidylglycerophosphate/cardiolipin synthase-like enzyme
MALSTTRLPPVVPGPVKIKPHARNTVVHPFDPVDNNASAWFPEAIGKSTLRIPNEVIPYIDGHAAFKDMVSAIRSATKRGHFIYLVGWRLVTDFQLIPGDGTTTIESLFTTASAMNVDIRVMLYHQHTELSGEDNTPAIKFVNELFNGAAIHDDRVVAGGVLADLGEIFQGIKLHYVGMHHQKVLIVNGKDGLVAFQGGMDENPDRLAFAGSPTVGLHDVHTRHRGQAAGSLWELFVERWTDHPQSVNFSAIPTALAADPAQTVTDNLQVEIGRTYPNSKSHSLFGPGGPYHFAETGEQSAKALVLNAIALSKKFIYIEDQYLFDMSISNALKAALPNLKKLIILITASTQIFDQRQPFARRKAFIDNLTGGVQPPTNKVIVCANKTGYVHSKTFIFDDKFAIVGSANLTRRGYSHDSEQNAGIFDPNTSKRFFFAHELRMNLWAKHLSKRPIDLVDPIASSVHWSSPIGNILTYVVAGADPPQKFPENILKDVVWNVGLDPDGT